ncbi:unnamed protein product [Caenorhabditis auriculariae]|uniref:Uncharacterized protein n=1 Tax=Caenorhabditis auriculariae TaxID=2777116 RepID=A0A8S1H7X8_9PELO|nr:unnamed protein product [Caenorhabditis auriculariae]
MTVQKELNNELRDSSTQNATTELTTAASPISEREKTEDDFIDERNLIRMPCCHNFCVSCAKKEKRETHLKCSYVLGESPEKAVPSPPAKASRDGISRSPVRGVGLPRESLDFSNRTQYSATLHRSSSSSAISHKTCKLQKAQDKCKVWYTFAYGEKRAAICVDQTCNYGDLMTRLAMYLGISLITHIIRLRARESSSDESSGSCLGAHIGNVPNEKRLTDLHLPRGRPLIVEVIEKRNTVEVKARASPKCDDSEDREF